MKKIKILLTFDYELPLGYAVDYGRGLFAPAESLLERANNIGVPLVLFADVCSSIRFESWDKKNYHDPFVAQLRKAVSQGHDLQLHIHPHWMTSTFSDGVFHPSLDFSLSHFHDDRSEVTIEGIIDQGFQKICWIGEAANADYKCVAYRAGGYDIGPEAPRVLHRLHDLGVLIDSSVIKGYILDYGFSKVDYSRAPESSSWIVPLDGPMTRTATHGMFELPVTSKPLSVSDIVSRRYKKWTQGDLLRSRAYKHGGKGFLTQQGGLTVASQFRKIFNPLVLSLDREYFDHLDLSAIVDYNIRKHENETGDLIITAIGHPKSMGEYHLDVMEKFVGDMVSRYGQRVSFVTYRDIAIDL